MSTCLEHYREAGSILFATKAYMLLRVYCMYIRLGDHVTWSRVLPSSVARCAVSEGRWVMGDGLCGKVLATAAVERVLGNRVTPTFLPQAS